MEPSRDQIEDQIALTIDHPQVYPGMSYTEGVSAALRWVTGDSDEPPIDPADAEE